eukprot:PhM_4_TR3068/c1_g4_i1/m.49727
MTTLLIAVNYGCRTNAHYNGIVFCGYDGFSAITSFTVPAGVDNGLITGGAFTPSDTFMRVNIDAEMKVLWIGAQLSVYKYKIVTSVATIISGLGVSGSTGDGPMPSTSYGWAAHPYQMARAEEILVVGANVLHRLRVTTKDATASATTSQTVTDTKATLSQLVTPSCTPQRTMTPISTVSMTATKTNTAASGTQSRTRLSTVTKARTNTYFLSQSRKSPTPSLTKKSLSGTITPSFSDKSTLTGTASDATLSVSFSSDHHIGVHKNNKPLRIPCTIPHIASHPHGDDDGHRRTLVDADADVDDDA